MHTITPADGVAAHYIGEVLNINGTKRIVVALDSTAGTLQVVPYSWWESSRSGKALRKAIATFLFGSIGQIIGTQILDADIATWKLAAGAGTGAILNFLYRWAEKAKDAA